MAINGSFEDIKDCPSRQGNFDLVRDAFWWGSVDLFSVCGEPEFSVPGNALGRQWPADGYSMADMIVTTQGYCYYEFLAGQMDTAHMIDGQEYCLSVKVSLAEESPYSINQLAFFFSEFNTSKTLFNERGYTRRVIYPWLNYNNRYNDPPGGRYTSGSNSFITPLYILPSSPENSGWITVKNTITYQKEHDYYFWLGGNSSQTSELKLENDNQFVFNPDLTVYYYTDDIKITEVEKDTQIIQPELRYECDKLEYVIDLDQNYDNLVCIKDSQELDVFTGNQAVFPVDQDFESLYIIAEYDDYCDQFTYQIEKPKQDASAKKLNTFFPNLATDVLSYHMVSNTVNQLMTIEIIDASGKKAKSLDFLLDTGLNKLSINSSDLSSGIYTLKVINGNCDKIQKVLIQR